MNEFEDELKSRPLRRVPEHWRAQILRAASATAPRHKHHPWWAALLWPSPKAWVTLAAAWALMACFSAATREGAVPRQSPESDQIRMAVEEKRRLQSEIEEASLQARTENPSPRSAVSHGEKSA